MKIAWIFLVLILFSLGCVQEKEIKEVKIPGHNTIYQFSYDIRESIKVKNNTGIRNAVYSIDTINFVFNSSNQEENAYFLVSAYNIVSKLNVYFPYEGKLMRFNEFFFDGGVWYNSTLNEIEKPDLTLSLWFLGPNTGANETSVMLSGNIIYIQGTSYKDLVLASDKFSMIVMGIDSVNV
ncbi:MAG: hypothetical protein V1900_02325 [Candidatus Aenigmatarchaeota archaeon]